MWLPNAGATFVKVGGSIPPVHSIKIKEVNIMPEKTIQNNPLEGLTEEQIKTITENMAPRKDYEDAIKRAKEAEALNSKLVLDGARFNDETNSQPTLTKEEAAIMFNETFSPDCRLSDIEVVENSLKLRDFAIKTYNYDPFVTHSSHVDISQADYDKAEEVAQVYRDALDYADGDNETFINELSRRMPNDSPIVKAKSRK